MNTVDRMRGCLLGLSCGDAVGTTVEFQPRGSFAPVTDMVGGGPFDLSPGDWTDDTSLALCLAESLVSCHGFNARDQMERYLRWLKEGYYSSTGECFDIGNTTYAALMKFERSGEPMSGSTDTRAAGNGSIMRLAPIPIHFYPNMEATMHYAAESSKTTHAAAQCVDACILFAAILHHALAGLPKEQVLLNEFRDMAVEPTLTQSIRAIADGDYFEKDEKDISGSGYVVESLEAALWSFYTTDTYEDAILRAVNLGEDADTTAAVCGQVAGAFYGIKSIPDRWLEKLTLHDTIDDLARRLSDTLI